MRQALIIGARPAQTVKKAFPRVPLGVGQWRFASENHKDSEITLHIERSAEEINSSLLNKEQLFDGPMRVRAEITIGGSEHYINIFAELIK